MAAAEIGGAPAMLRLIRQMSSILNRIAERNDVVVDAGARNSATIFDGSARPAISVESYMERIFKYANCSPACFVVAYVYLDRFVRRQPLILISPFNVHRLIIASVLVSVKFMDDIYYSNGYYAKIGGISKAEMNLLELDFLFGIGFQLNVTPNTFHHYCSFLQAQMLLQFPPPLIASPSESESDSSIDT
ncbi:cyclin-U4-1-like [Andrographis paniculata]|uniref:cyclin-U4-1-like n=1 Tax=Andrographis paniculata TaxID=175694 RepID=UPI0021E78F4E|nr:cyclin-U4-1-like [Andrographis paniculata]